MIACGHMSAAHEDYVAASTASDMILDWPRLSVALHRVEQRADLRGRQLGGDAPSRPEGTEGAAHAPASRIGSRPDEQRAHAFEHRHVLGPTLVPHPQLGRDLLGR